MKAHDLKDAKAPVNFRKEYDALSPEAQEVFNMVVELLKEIENGTDNSNRAIDLFTGINERVPNLKPAEFTVIANVKNRYWQSDTVVMRPKTPGYF